MPIPLFNSVASWFLKKRIHQIELFRKFPNEVQQEVLRKLLVYNIDTEIGKKYDFKSIKSYKDFNNRLDAVSYEDISQSIERMRKGEQNIFWSTPINWFANQVELLMQRVSLSLLALKVLMIAIIKLERICYHYILTIMKTLNF